MPSSAAGWSLCIPILSLCHRVHVLAPFCSSPLCQELFLWCPCTVPAPQLAILLLAPQNKHLSSVLYHHAALLHSSAFPCSTASSREIVFAFPIPKGEINSCLSWRCIKHGHAATRLYFYILFGSGHLFPVSHLRSIPPPCPPFLWGLCTMPCSPGVR